MAEGLTLFERIIGQDLAKKVLESRLRKQRFPSALLFYGPRGVGKRTLALVLTRVLNCRESKLGYCGSCASCRAVGDLAHPNLRIIFPVRRVSGLQGFPDPELYNEQGTISIDMVRLLRKESSLRPYQEGKRVFIVLDADRMKEEAQNAFLKLLEEPPSDTTVILTTSRPDALASTILSRCQRVRFGRLPASAIEKSLVEKSGADRQRAHLVASLSEGSLGRAERMLEVFAEEHRRKVIDFVFAERTRDDLDILDFAQELVNDDLAYPTLEVIQSIYRDVLALKMGADQTLVNTDREELLRRVAVGVTWDSIYGIILMVEEAAGYLARNVNARLVLFNLLAGIREDSGVKV